MLLTSFRMLFYFLHTEQQQTFTHSNHNPADWKRQRVKVISMRQSDASLNPSYARVISCENEWNFKISFSRSIARLATACILLLLFLSIFEAEEIVQAKLQALSKLTNGGTKADRRWSDNLGISGTRGSRGHRPRSASSDTDASGDSQDQKRTLNDFNFLRILWNLFQTLQDRIQPLKILLYGSANCISVLHIVLS